MVKKYTLIHNSVIPEMVYPSGIKRTASADDAMNFVAFFKKQFCQVRTVLAGNAGDEGFFHGCMPKGPGICLIFCQLSPNHRFHWFSQINNSFFRILIIYTSKLYATATSGLMSLDLAGLRPLTFT